MQSTVKILTLLSLVLLSACSTNPEKTTVTTVEPIITNDFPTADRIEYFLECVAKKGGLSYVTQANCICKVDKLAEKMSYKEYSQARTFTFLRTTPGENGAVFRDPKHAKALRKQLKKAEQYGNDRCFVSP